MVPEASRQAVKRALLKEIAAHRNRLSTGFVSTPYLLAFLSEEAPEVGWMMTSAQDYPSWWGMTAGSDQDLLKETWAGGQALMPSLGGNLVAWYEQALAGIRPDPAGPGFKKVIIKPYVPEEVHWVESHYDSVHGRIATRWRKRGEEFSLEVRIPPSVTATVTVPSRAPSTVTESGKPISQGEGVTALGEDAGKATYAVTSGVYHFRSQLPATIGKTQ
jgi:alpha-L-rhamnosidase